jgi:hypothetical protein
MSQQLEALRGLEVTKDLSLQEVNLTITGLYGKPVATYALLAELLEKPYCDGTADHGDQVLVTAGKWNKWWCEFHLSGDDAAVIVSEAGETLNEAVTRACLALLRLHHQEKEST